MACYTKAQLESMLQDVVSVLPLSAEALEKHGPLGTEPAELVRLVLAEKDLQIATLRAGLKDVNHGKQLK